MCRKMSFLFHSECAIFADYGTKNKTEIQLVSRYMISLISVYILDIGVWVRADASL